MIKVRRTPRCRSISLRRRGAGTNTQRIAAAGVALRARGVVAASM